MAADGFYRVNFRARMIGGGVVPGKIWPPGREGELAEYSHITLLLHGYNVDQTKGKRLLTGLAALLPSAQESGAIIAVLWPGDSKMGALSFPFDVNDADDTTRALLRFLFDDIHLRRDQTLSFVTHSLGARVALGTIDALRLKGFPVGQVCLMAAALDNNSLANPREYRKAVKAATRVSVLASKKDRVLKWAYPAGDFLETLFHFRDSPRLALGYTGPKPYQSNQVPGNVFPKKIAKGRKSDHGHYLPVLNAEGQEKQNQDSAAHFANDTLEGEAAPKYP